jgi:hypothetical protein
MMDFKLSDGSSLLLECSGEGVYFQTPKDIFRGTAEPGLWELVSGLVSPPS